MSPDVREEQSIVKVRNTIRNYIVESILFGDGRMLEDNTSFQDSGILDSTGMLEIITFVEEEFGIEIADSEVVPENLGTLEKISKFVDGKLSDGPAPESPS